MFDVNDIIAGFDVAEELVMRHMAATCRSSLFEETEQLAIGE
jgi:hypothetical protein